MISTAQYKIVTSSYNEQASYQNHLTESVLLSKSYQMFLNMFTYSLIPHLFTDTPSVTIVQAYLFLLKWLKMFNF